MMIDTNGWSTSDVLIAAWRLVASSEAIIASGCVIDKDEVDLVEDLRIICQQYLSSHDRRFS